MTDEQIRLILLGVEFGYREYEKGNNLQKALETAKVWMTRDPNRCAVCGQLLGICTRGNCSMRPLPLVRYDAERAEREYLESHWSKS